MTKAEDIGEQVRRFVELVADMHPDGECDACGYRPQDDLEASEIPEPGMGCPREGCGGVLFSFSEEDAYNTLHDLIAEARKLRDAVRREERR